MNGAGISEGWQKPVSYSKAKNMPTIFNLQKVEKMRQGDKLLCITATQLTNHARNMLDKRYAEYDIIITE